jgi:hypothetical protein
MVLGGVDECKIARALRERHLEFATTTSASSQLRAAGPSGPRHQPSLRRALTRVARPAGDGRTRARQAGWRARSQRRPLIRAARATQLLNRADTRDGRHSASRSLARSGAVGRCIGRARRRIRPCMRKNEARRREPAPRSAHHHSSRTYASPCAPTSCSSIALRSTGIRA